MAEFRNQDQNGIECSVKVEIIKNEPILGKIIKILDIFLVNY